MRKIVLIFLLGMLTIPGVRAVVAYPWPLDVVLPDGSSLTLCVHGDEFGGYTTTTDGYRVTRGFDGFYYYETSTYVTKNGATIGTRANNPARRTATERAALGNALRELTAVEITQGRELRNQAASLFKNRDIGTKASTVKHPERLLVLMVEFSDTKFTATNSKQAIADIFNKTKYLGYGSVKDYYVENSGGAYNPTFDVFGVATMANESNFYAKNNMKNMSDLVVSVCRALSGVVNFANYDSDGDGVVDNVYIVFAGHNQAEGGGASTIWPHASDIRSSGTNLTLNGKKIGPYACGSEYRLASGTTLSGVGTFCHEFGHILGLMDMYDTDSEQDGGSAPGLFNVSLMSSGNYNNASNTPPSLNAYERYALGWLDLPELLPGNVTLQAINLNKGYRISTTTPNEFFVLEVRDNTGWDKYITPSSSTPFQGLLIYQVDQSDRLVNGTSAKLRWPMNLVNTFPDHMCMRLRPASNLANELSGSPYPGKTGNNSFTRLSQPAAVSWDNVPLGVEISNVTYDALRASFTVRTSQIYRSVQGSIVDQDAKPLANVMVRMIPVSTTKSRTEPMSLLLLGETTKADGSFVVASDASGRFNFTTLPEGRYTLSTSLYGYQPYAQTVTVQGDDLIVPKIMMPTTPVALASLISHYNGMPMGFLTATEAVDGVRMQWTAEMIADKAMVGDVINNIFWNTGYANQTCRASIRVNNYAVETFEFISQAGVNIIPVPNPVTVEAGKSLIVEIETPKTAGNIVGIDVGPGVTMYGDLVRYNGNWVSASKNVGLSLNIALGYVKDKNPPILQLAKLQITKSGQRDVTLAWGSTDVSVDKWVVELKNGLNGEVRTLEFDNPKVIFITKLLPSTLYTATVYPVYGGTKGETASKEFTTQPLTAPFAAMTLSVKNPAVGQKVTLGITNAPKEVENVEWEVNDFLVRGEGVQFTFSVPANMTELLTLARVKYADGTKEVIIRKIIVKN